MQRATRQPPITLFSLGCGSLVLAGGSPGPRAIEKAEGGSGEGRGLPRYTIGGTLT